MSGYLMRRTPQKIARWWTRDYLPHDGTLQEQHREKKALATLPGASIGKYFHLKTCQK
jgi:hypothetical protein